MKKIFSVISILLCAGGAAAEEKGSYALNPGDVLEISVWKEQGLERQVLVLPDGMISFPLAGHLRAAGRTAEEVQAALVERIKPFIPDAVITVSVQNAAGNKIYVIGQVNNPGEFSPTHPLTVMQALTLAGGLTPFGDEDDIVILRHKSGEQIALPFDYSDVKRGKNLELNIILESGDVVVVPD